MTGISAAGELSNYIEPAVKLEFGARATGEPSKSMDISCDVANHVEGVTLPTASPMVMLAERTFWEKATAVHVYCKNGKFRGGHRLARHWFDLVCLFKSGHAQRAMQDPMLAKSVANHKNAFFPEKDMDRQKIDYLAAVRGEIQLVPIGEEHDSLAADYATMVDEGVLFDEAPSFDAIMSKCKQLESAVNDTMSHHFAGSSRSRKCDSSRS